MEKKFLGGYTPEWYAAIEKPRDLIYQYNNLHPSELERKYERTAGAMSRRNIDRTAVSL